ncbi:MAG: hypothetical protein DWQ47_17400 [Acidobacteria bacterium]|nr:MAG: hypothetical protein DWQ32_04800 [Acidobacteriota bacterium]REK02184.1 MAG: hypothetical protein DWQ38_07355 [Acidobacteriota bacterium]REK14014.1 MAG: hypothetical protein DWQ43_10490 [Acidobacteriota bacterium]REK42009.1 MAG: hypothetical protein DWQ47_17400 [Acidobacteriota bacterium]
MRAKYAAVLLALLLGSYAISAQGSIRDVDFQNFTYEVEFCRNELTDKITVTNGNFSEEKEVDGYTERRYFEVYGEVFGDLTGDGAEEAVVLSICNTGGTGNFSEAYIFSMSEGEPVLRLTIEGGDRAYGGLREARIEKGILIIESNDPGEFGANCCAEVAVTRRYRLKGDSLEETAPPERRDLYPAERVEFDKGSYSKEIQIELGEDPGIKRFVISASKGQRLTVNSPSDKVRFRLVKGEAEMEEENKTLVADLQEDGDFIFEVRNFSESELSTSITVSVR